MRCRVSIATAVLLVLLTSSPPVHAAHINIFDKQNHFQFGNDRFDDRHSRFAHDDEWDRDRPDHWHDVRHDNHHDHDRRYHHIDSLYDRHHDRDDFDFHLPVWARHHHEEWYWHEHHHHHGHGDWDDPGDPMATPLPPSLYLFAIALFALCALARFRSHSSAH